MCEHNKKAKIFCAREQCDHSVSFGCMECIKKYHKNTQKEALIEEDELLNLLKVYQVPNHIKQQRKGPLYRLYQMLNNCKKQISEQLDRYFGGILNKLKYPFLYHENILDAYRIIRDKNYHKLGHSDLLSFYKTSKKLNSQAFLAQEVQFYQQYVRETQDSIQELKNKIRTIQNILQFKISQQTLKMKHDVSNQFAELAKHIQKQQQSASLRHKITVYKAREELFLTPKKSEEYLDISMEKSGSIMSCEDKQSSKLEQILPKTIRYERTGSISKQTNQSMLLFSTNKLNATQKKQKQKQNQQKTLKLNKNNHSHSRLNEYQGKTSQTDSIFIKISEASPQIHMESSIGQKLNFFDTNSTIHQSATATDKKDPIKLKQQNVKKRLSDLIKQKGQKQAIKAQAHPETLNESELIKSNSKDSKDFALSKNKLESRQSHFLSVVNKRKVSQDASFSDSLSKDVFDFPREDRPKLISKSIKKQIPLLEGNTVKSQPSPINQHQPSSQRQLQMAAIFLSGINQPSTQNKICFLQKYITKYDSNLTAIQYLSYLYLQHGKPKECHNLCSSYLDKLSSCRDERSINTLIINNCAALNQLGRYSETIQSLQDRLKKSENAHMHKIIADAYFSFGVVDKAVYHYERATKLNPQLDEAYYNLAVILYQQNSFFNAKMNIDKALKLTKNNFYIQLHMHIQERIQMTTQQS